MDAKTKLFTSGWKFDKEQNILHSFKVYLLMREKIVILKWRNLLDTILKPSDQNDHHQ